MIGPWIRYSRKRSARHKTLLRGLVGREVAVPRVGIRARRIFHNLSTIRCIYHLDVIVTEDSTTTIDHTASSVPIMIRIAPSIHNIALSQPICRFHFKSISLVDGLRVTVMCDNVVRKLQPWRIKAIETDSARIC